MLIRMVRDDGPDLTLSFPLIPRIKDAVLVNGTDYYVVESVEFRTRADETHHGYTTEVVLITRRTASIAV